MEKTKIPRHLLGYVRNYLQTVGEVDAATPR